MESLIENADKKIEDKLCVLIEVDLGLIFRQKRKRKKNLIHDEEKVWYYHEVNERVQIITESAINTEKYQSIWKQVELLDVGRDTKQTEIDCEKKDEKTQKPILQRRWIIYPDELSAPDHLLNEFTEIFSRYFHRLTPKVRKYFISPGQKLDVRSMKILRLVKDTFSSDHLFRMIKILERKTDLTLSLLDFVCTNYSKSHPIQYTLMNEDGKEETISLHQSYSDCLKIYSRDFFDVFCRKERIVVEVIQPIEECSPIDLDELENFLSNHDSFELQNTSKILWDCKMTVGKRRIGKYIHFYILTAVRQLVFFFWAFKHKVIDYCEKNLHSIKAAFIQIRSQQKSTPKRLSAPSHSLEEEKITSSSSSSSNETKKKKLH